MKCKCCEKHIPDKYVEGSHWFCSDQCLNTYTKLRDIDYVSNEKDFVTYGKYEGAEKIKDRHDCFTSIWEMVIDFKGPKKAFEEIKEFVHNLYFEACGIRPTK